MSATLAAGSAIARAAFDEIRDIQHQQDGAVRLDAGSAYRFEVAKAACQAADHHVAFLQHRFDLERMRVGSRAEQNPRSTIDSRQTEERPEIGNRNRHSVDDCELAAAYDLDVLRIQHANDSVEGQSEGLAGDRHDQALDDCQRDGHDDPELGPQARMVHDLDRSVDCRDGGRDYVEAHASTRVLGEDLGGRDP